MPVKLSVNGRQVEVDAAPMAPLATVLREKLHLLGTKTGCYEGRCGACTVAVDGRAVASCIYPVAIAQGSAIQTVEGLAAPDEDLRPLQSAMLEAGGVQCGMCTPGILMALTCYLADNPDPSEEDVRAALDGNVCRCTGYQQIVEAALAVAKGHSR
jgi:carbon-monoxide dehydrogenase small subunit